MAVCIPDRLPQSASNGEKRLFGILSNLPDDCIVYYEPIVENRFADFIVLIPSIGLIVIEVKGWYPNDILGGDLENVMVMNRGTKQSQRHPIRQAREYMISLMHTCQRHKAFKRLVHAIGKYQGHFLYPFGYFSILSNATRSQVEQTGNSVLFPKDKAMTRDVLLSWEALSPGESLDLLKSYFDPWWPIQQMSAAQVDLLRAIIHPEVILLSFMDDKNGSGEETLKVLDVRQENHARNVGSGHRIICGVPGSGKTVILIARARLIAGTTTGKQHLFLCYNVALALHLRNQLKDIPNVTVRHFDGWCKDQNISRNFKEDDDSLGSALLKSLKDGNGHVRKYNSIFIDEAQDFAESWFSCALEAMEDRLDGDLVIVGDGNQGVYRRRPFTWASVGIQAVGRTIHSKFDLDRCYRSTREIMALAQAFTTGNDANDESSMAAMSVDPNSCTRSSGFKPVVMSCQSLEEECQYAAAIVKELLEGKWFGRTLPEPLMASEIGILYREAGDQAKEAVLSDLEKAIGSAIWINRSRDARKRIVETGVKIQTIHSAKGLQYKAVIILWAAQMPSTRPNDDPVLERRLMFVAMTRTEDYLTVLHSRHSSYVDELVATGVSEVIQMANAKSL